MEGKEGSGDLKYLSVHNLVRKSGTYNGGIYILTWFSATEVALTTSRNVNVRGLMVGDMRIDFVT